MPSPLNYHLSVLFLSSLILYRDQYKFYDMKETIIQTVLDGMRAVLTDNQLELLTDVTRKALSECEITPKLAEEEQRNKENAELLGAFISSKKVEGCSDKTIHYYKSSIEKLIATVKKNVCRENGIVEVVNVAGSNESYVEDEKNDIRSISYQIIKKFVCYLAAAFCLFAVFEAIRLYMNRKKADIMILWSAGSKKTVILKMLIKELGMAVLIGVVLAFAAEWLIYGVILGCNLKTVFIYGAYSFAAVVVLTIIMITVMLAAMLHKPVISIIKKEQ